MSSFWSGWIIVLAVGNILACFWLIWWTMRKRAGEAATGDVTGHTWDGNLQEYNNPLPRWWLWLFYGTLAFAGIYLTLYPGLGSFPGYLGWSSHGSQLKAEMEKADKTYGPLFAKYGKIPVADLGTKAEYQEARDMGKRLFLTYCMQCHGSTGAGARGFPNLTDSDWLWGGSPETIEESILVGRGDGTPGAPPRMPAHGDKDSPILTADQIVEVTEYVQSLSGRNVDRAKAEKGKATFDTICAACHGPDGKGLQPLGAPNLTDNVWLYGGSAAAIKESIVKGRNGYMPPQKDLLGTDKVRILAGYVYSLSQK
jgi:cytochrome c oxidase cbb3-type subunit 3